jgi:hypothetical protein
VGPTASIGSKRMENVYDERGNYRQNPIPGNETKCLADKWCRYTSFFKLVIILGPLLSHNVLIISLQSMTEGSVIYGLINIYNSKAGNCKPISTQSYCVTWQSSQSHCASTGGIYNEGQSGSCYHPFKTPETCLTQTYCDTTKSLSDANRCSGFCVHKNYTVNSGGTTSAFRSYSNTLMTYPIITASISVKHFDNLCKSPWSWNSNLQICVQYQTSQQCQAGGHTYAFKYTWMEGMWDSIAKCTATCDIPSFSWTPAATKVSII